jgi:GT2 family glycosyltransferase
MIDVSVIIVGTNEKQYVLQCLESIYDTTETTHSYETIFVDNASEDGTSDVIKKRFANVAIIRNAKKIGYIENNNLAMDVANGRYYLILNADVKLHKNTMQIMVDFMDAHINAAVSACKLLFEDGSLQLTCRQFPTPWTYLCRIPHFFQWIGPLRKFTRSKATDRYLMLEYDHQRARQVDWVLSAFFLMRRSAVEQLGKFDESLVPPFYLEDVEWCFRARLNGWNTYYVPEVNATHYYQQGSIQTFNRLSFTHLANVLIFFGKHGLSMLLKRHRKKNNEGPVT